MSRTLENDSPHLGEEEERPSQIRYRVAFVALAFLVFFFLVMFSVGRTRSELTIVLRNTGNEPMRSVVVRLPDASRVMGHLPAGGRRSVRTRATRNSRLIIEFLDRRGQPQNLQPNVAVRPGEVGTLTIDLTPRGVQRVVRDTRGGGA